MPGLLEIEETDEELPLLALFGNNGLILNSIIRDFANKFRVVVVSDKKPDFSSTTKIYFLEAKNASLLPKLQEKFDYSVALIDESSRDENLSYFMAKCVADKSRILIIADAFSLEKNISHLKTYKDIPRVFFAITGELISWNGFFGPHETSKIIENAIANRAIPLSGNETHPVYVTMEDNFFAGISRLLFGNIKSDVCHLLYYEHPQTVLETAHLIGRVDPDIKISFSASHTAHEIVTRDKIKEHVRNSLGMDISYMAPQGGFEKEYASLLERREELLENHNDKKNGTKKRVRRFPKKYISFVFTNLFFGLFLFLFVNFLFFGLCLLFLNNSIRDLKNNDFRSGFQNARTADIFLKIVHPFAGISLDALGPVDKNGTIEKKYLLLQRFINLAKIAGDSSNVFSKKGVELKTLESSVSNISYLFQEGQRLILETNNKELQEKLKPTYSKLLSFSSVLPFVLGFDESRNYLLLFQNDEELRPTGGFIGSVGDLTIKKARVESLAIQDVYELDGQLKNHVEPPFIVRRYLQPHLYLRDSNFFLNYQETASTSAFIYNLESGKRPDGVIAIDLRVLKEILKLSGPIKLPNYNIVVTQDNVSSFIQNTIKDNFFPGSTQKKDVLNSLFNQLVLKLASDSKFYISLLQKLPDLLEQKDILVSYSNNSVQKIFSANNYGGEFSYKPSTDAKKISDFLYINEANIGVNKVNADVSRKVSYEAMLEQGRVVSKARLSLMNNSKTDEYKVYLKFVVPAGSVLSQILVNNVKQNTTPAIIDFKVYEAKNFKKPDGLELEQYTSGSLTYFAFIATAKIGKNTEIGIDYINGAGKTLSTIADYVLTYVKQPGTSPYELLTTLDYPEGYLPIDTKADSYGKNFLESKVVVDHDFQTNVEIQKSSVQK